MWPKVRLGATPVHRERVRDSLRYSKRQDECGLVGLVLVTGRTRVRAQHDAAHVVGVVRGRQTALANGGGNARELWSWRHVSSADQDHVARRLDGIDERGVGTDALWQKLGIVVRQVVEGYVVEDYLGVKAREVVDDPRVVRVVQCANGFLRQRVDRDERHALIGSRRGEQLVLSGQEWPVHQPESAERADQHSREEAGQREAPGQ